MKDTVIRRGLWIVTAVVLVAGVWQSVRSVRVLRQSAAFVRQRSTERRRLENLAAEAERFVTARAAYEAIPGNRAVELDVLVRQALEGSDPEDVRESRTRALDEWVLRRKDVVLSDVAMPDVMRLVRQAEAQRPPWLLAECVLQAAPMAPGRGRAVLTFEVLERSSSASP